MRDLLFDLGHKKFPVKVPDFSDILRMGNVSAIPNPEAEIYRSLRSPIKSPPLREIVRKKHRSNPKAEAVIVISDNTRPVPYSGKEGILFPILDEMIQAGLAPHRIRLLVATGTHRTMDDGEVKEMLDPRVIALNLPIINHDSRNKSDMMKVGHTEFGGEISVNRFYMESEIKILTGLVESHFMAGASGGRKSICPGLISEALTHALHSGPILHSPQARDLVLEGNPVHQECLKVAKMAGCDMIVNVTLDADYKLTGVFAGDLEEAHQEAVKKLRTYAAIPVQKEYDLVITHAGFVGVNHYQAAKGALVCVPVIKQDGFCLLAACHTDKDPIGMQNYKRMIRLLGEVGTDTFIQMILDPAWAFVPEQWEAQMWTRLFEKSPPGNLLYCSLEIAEDDFAWIPGTDTKALVGKTKSLQELTNKSIEWAVHKLKTSLGHTPLVAVLPDGPYGIPVKVNGSLSTPNISTQGKST
ncbi:MAG: nickel-dependent lactate racemase [Candidatus Aminicenantes bacterium]|nr:nickel-dependent lactate racemase [Candidatus Aminicenantes bacterium]MDH5384205.1 nickel-dependent lactate racemase [Candidatus Aminicenantes bacterium]MDH5744870.1 nickel-dependent lactate racemase [Candidatus Aminicenantes bacterium]